MHLPGKHHSHTDELSRRTSHLRKRDTWHECATFLNQVTHEEELARTLAPCDQYQEDSYIKPVDDDFALFRDLTAPVPPPTVPAIPPGLLWYMGGHPAKDDGPNTGGSPPDAQGGTAISHVIEL